MIFRSACHFFLKMLAISAFVVLGVFVFSNALDETAWRAPADGTFFPVLSSEQGSLSLLEMAGATLACFAFLIGINAIFEAISLLVVWWSIAAVRPSGGH